MMVDEAQLIAQVGRPTIHRLRTWTRVPGRAVAACGMTLGSAVVPKHPDAGSYCGRWGCFRGTKIIRAYDYETEGFGGT